MRVNTVQTPNERICFISMQLKQQIQNCRNQMSLSENVPVRLIYSTTNATGQASIMMPSIFSAPRFVRTNLIVSEVQDVLLRVLNLACFSLDSISENVVSTCYSVQMPMCVSVSKSAACLVRLGDSASHNSIFLSRQISQPANQQYFSLTPNQLVIQPASQPNKASKSFGGTETRRLQSPSLFI